MQELTNLETKLGEVIGLAMAAQVSIDRISKLANGDRSLVKQMKTMRSEAAEAEKRGTQSWARSTARRKILSEARSVKRKGADMMKTYLDRDADLDGMEFMTMPRPARLATGRCSPS